MYVVFDNNYHIRTMYLVFDNNHHIRSLRKQPFLLALQRWGRCETSSATKSYHIRTMYIAFDNNYHIRTMYIVFNNMNALNAAFTSRLLGD